MSIQESAIAYHDQGYNCAQSVLAALQEEKAFLFDEPSPIRTGARQNAASARFGSARDEANAAIRAALGRSC